MQRAIQGSTLVDALGLTLGGAIYFVYGAVHDIARPFISSLGEAMLDPYAGYVGAATILFNCVVVILVALPIAALLRLVLSRTSVGARIPRGMVIYGYLFVGVGTTVLGMLLLNQYLMEARPDLAVAAMLSPLFVAATLYLVLPAGVAQPSNPPVQPTRNLTR